MYWASLHGKEPPLLRDGSCWWCHVLRWWLVLGKCFPEETPGALQHKPFTVAGHWKRDHFLETQNQKTGRRLSSHSRYKVFKGDWVVWGNFWENQTPKNCLWRLNPNRRCQWASWSTWRPCFSSYDRYPLLPCKWPPRFTFCSQGTQQCNEPPNFDSNL